MNLRKLGSSVAKGARGEGAAAPPIIAKDEFYDSSKSVEKLRGGGVSCIFSYTCGSMVCQCYEGNRNEILELQ